VSAEEEPAMDSTELDLGRLDLVSTTSDMQVQVTSSAHFAPPTQGAGERTLRLTTGLFSYDAVCQRWVLAAHDYRFELHMKVQGGMAASQHEITNAVAAVISTAAVGAT